MEGRERSAGPADPTWEENTPAGPYPGEANRGGGAGLILGGAEVLDFELEADALAVFVADKFEGDVPGGAGEVLARTVEVDGGEEFFASADAEADVFFFEHVGAVHGCDGAGVEKRGGVAHAAGFEQG